MKCLLALAGLFLLVFGASGCRDGAQKSAGAAEYRLTYNVFFPSSHAAAKLAMEWAAEIGRRTAGRLRIDVYAGSVLSNDSENYNCVVFGATDIGMSCFAYNRGLFPLIECLDLPHGYKDGAQATRIANEFIAHFAPKELDDVELMYVHAHGPGVLASHRHVESIDDVKKLRLRGTGVTAMAIGAIGGSAVGLSQGETYEALRKGVVEGTLCPIETLNGWKQGEVIDYVTKIPSLGYTTAMFVVMNKRSWAALPADLQEIVRAVNREFIVKHGRKWDEMDREAELYVMELGKQIGTVTQKADSEFKTALDGVLKSWVVKAERRGLPGAEAVEFIQSRIHDATAKTTMAH